MLVPFRQQKAAELSIPLLSAAPLRPGDHRAQGIGGDDPRAAAVDHRKQLIRGAVPIRDGNPRDDAAGLGGEHRELGGKRASEGLGEVVSSRRACGFLRASATARCSATTVLPVPAEPATRAAPANSRSTMARCDGCRKTPQRSHG